MNPPPSVVAWAALAVSVIVGILSFMANRGDGAVMLGEEVAALVAQVDAVDEKLAAVPGAFDPAPLEARLDALDARVDDLAGKVAALPMAEPFDPAPLVARLDALDGKVETATTALDPEALQAKVDELAGKVEALPAPEPFDPAPLKRQIDELSLKVEAAGFDPAPLQSRVDDIATRIAALKSFDPTPLQKQLDALNAVITSREGGTAERVTTQRLLGQIYFDTGQTTLTEEARAMLNGWIGNLAGKPHRLAILGFADSVGHAAYNVSLSIRRAAVVRGYLLRSGLADGSVVVSAGGYGEEGAPIQTGDGVAEPKNRTVTVYVYE